MKKNPMKTLVLVSLAELIFFITMIFLFSFRVLRFNFNIATVIFFVGLITGGLAIFYLSKMLKSYRLQIAAEKKRKEEIEARQKRLLDLYDLFGIAPQRKPDGTLKSFYELLGLTPEFDEFGERIPTIYELLQVAPEFDADGNEIPRVVIIKNRFKKVVKGTIDGSVSFKRKITELERIALMAAAAAATKKQPAAKVAAKQGGGAKKAGGGGGKSGGGVSVKPFQPIKNTGKTLDVPSVLGGMFYNTGPAKDFKIKLDKKPEDKKPEVKIEKQEKKEATPSVAVAAVKPIVPKLKPKKDASGSTHSSFDDVEIITFGNIMRDGEENSELKAAITEEESLKGETKNEIDITEEAKERE